MAKRSKRTAGSNRTAGSKNTAGSNYTVGSSRKSVDRNLQDEKRDMSPMQLPQTIYASVILALKLIPWMEDDRTGAHLFLQVFPQFLWLVINLFVQISFLVFLGFEVQKDCPDSVPSRYLLGPAMSAYVLKVLNEATETRDMAVYFLSLETQNENKLTIRETWDLEDGSSEKKKELISGMTRFQQFVVIVIVVSKCIIGVGLLTLGSLFIYRSESNYELILNAFALFFILEIDELVYTFGTDHHLKQNVEDMPTISPKEGTCSYKCAAFIFLCSPVAKPALVTILVVAAILAGDALCDGW